MKNLTALLAGLIFGLGLILSGMTDPHKVLGFLDIAGLWDPSLAFVMGGAVSVTAVAFAVARRRQSTAYAMALPTTGIDRSLVLGALIFGVGWGLAGICPGPAIVLVGSGAIEGWIFALGMAAGMLGFSLLERCLRRRSCGGDREPA